jgi:hypothetical protein
MEGFNTKLYTLYPIYHIPYTTNPQPTKSNLRSASCKCSPGVAHGKGRQAPNPDTSEGVDQKSTAPLKLSLWDSLGSHNDKPETLKTQVLHKEWEYSWMEDGDILHPERSTPNAQHQTHKSKPRTPNLKPRTLNPDSQDQNTQALNSTPANQERNPESEFLFQVLHQERILSAL